MKRIDQGYRITKFNKTVVAVAVGAMFAVASGGAMAVDVGAAGTTITADEANNYVFSHSAQTLTIDATTTNVTVAGTLGQKATVATGASVLELKTAATKTATLSGAVTNVADTGSTGTIQVKVSGATAAATGNATLGAAATVDTIVFASNGTLTITGAATVGSTTTNATGTDGRGTLTLSGGGTFTGNVGANGAALAALNVGAGGAVNFNGAAQVFATTTTLNGTNTVTFANGLKGTTLAFGAQNGTVVVSAGNLDANVTATNTGTLKLNGASTVSGTVGSSGSAIANLEAGAGGAVVFSATSAPVYATTTTMKGNNNVTFSGGLSGTTLAFGNTAATAKIGAGYNLAAAATSTGGTAGKGTVQFLGATTLTSALGATGDVLTAVKFDTGTVSIGSDIYALGGNGGAASSGTISLGDASAATVTYTASKAFGGDMKLNNSSTLNLGVYTLTGTTTANVGSSFTTTTGTTIKTTLNTATGTDTTNFGNVKLNTGGIGSNLGKATIVAGTNVYVTVNSGISIANGTKYTIVDGAAGTAGVATLTGTISTNSAVLTFTQDTSTTDDLVLQANRSSSTTYASAGGLTATNNTGYGAATSLNTIAAAGTATGSVATLISYMDGLSATQLASESPKLAPTSAAAVSGAAFGATTGAIGTVTTRLSAMRSDTRLAMSDESGVAAGDPMSGKAFWVKGFGSTASQGKKDSFDGYKGDTWGAAFGTDVELSKDTRVGLALSYADTKVKVQDTRAGDSTKLRSYQLTAYGTKELGAAYVEGMLAYTDHKYATRRAVPQSLVATGDFGGDQWTAKVGGGYRMKSGATTFTPLASLTYSTLTRKGYTELNGGGANLTYAGQTTDSIKSGLGFSLSSESEKITPEVHLIWSHEFGDRRVDTTSNFAGGARFTTTGMEIDRNSYNLGGSLKYATSKTSNVAVQYDYDTRSGYNSHTAQLTGRWAF